ncbi:MAG: bifunctional ornithine acetyltransferase/N-acetylglutamate synthase, partial [Pseudomonadota bacterium]
MADAKKTDSAKKRTKKLAKRRAKLAELTAEIAALEAELGEEAPEVEEGLSPLAPDGFPDLPAVAGVRLATAAAEVKYTGRTDVMLAELAPGTAMAGSFTRSETRAAPVLWCQEKLPELAEKAGTGRRKLGILVNSGNANAFTGSNGMTAVAEIATATAKALGTANGHVLMASTGVIGEPLPSDRITGVLGTLINDLGADGFEAAARAIMTTDTYPKGAGLTVELDGAPVAISGIAKGSGMIAPDMATMLVFIFTDCAIAQPLLQATVARLTGSTFNAITVDSDTSTSDTLLVAATGKAPMPPILSRRDRRFAAFEAGLAEVMRDLALLVVRDGEGASKLVEITVSGAKTDRA